MSVKWDGRIPERRPFIASTESRERFADYIKDALDLRSVPMDKWADAFRALDRDGSGSIERAEVGDVMRIVYGRAAPGDHVRQFMAHFDKNKDGRVSWDEFVLGLEVAKKQIEGSVLRKVTKRAEMVGGEGRTHARTHTRERASARPHTARPHAQPWMTRSETRVVGREAVFSSTSRDMGGAGEDPRARPLVAGSGMASTTTELNQGTTKSSFHLPGYGGFVPAAKTNPRALGHATAERPRADGKSFQRLTTRVNKPGYTGYAPESAQYDLGPRKVRARASEGAAGEIRVCRCGSWGRSHAHAPARARTPAAGHVDHHRIGVRGGGADVGDAPCLQLVIEAPHPILPSLHHQRTRSCARPLGFAHAQSIGHEQLCMSTYRMYTVARPRPR